MGNALKYRLGLFVWYILILCAVTPLRVHSQHYLVNIQEIGSSYGLESVVIRNIYQDSKGFLWIYTSSGLARFDGYFFKYYENEAFIGKMNSVVEIHGEIDGKLLVFHRNLFSSRFNNDQGRRIMLFDPDKDIIESFREGIGQNAPFSESNVSTIRQFQDIVFVGTNDGQVYEYKKEAWQLLFKGAKDMAVDAISVPSYGRPFWVYQADTLQLLSPKGERLESTYLKSEYSEFRRLRLDHKGNLWIVLGNRKGQPQIYFKAPSTPLQTYHPGYGLNFGDYDDVFFDLEGRAWFYKAGKYHVFEEGKVKVFDFEGQGSILNVPEHFVDRNNQIWLSLQQRFILVQIRKKRFENYLQEKTVSTRGMVEIEPGKIWVLTNNGTFELSLDNQTSAVKVRENAHGFGLIHKPPYVWMGTHGSSVVRIDPQTKAEVLFTLKKWSAGSVQKIHLLVPFMDRRGQVWVGTNYGLVRIDTLHQQAVWDPRFNGKGLSEREIIFLYENKQGIWAATDNGLFLIDPEKGVKQVFKHFPVSHITYIYEKPAGTFWLGTRSGGLLRWNQKTDDIQAFDKSSGFSNENIHAIFEDAQERLWMSTDRGLICFDIASQAVRVFYKNDGITHDEFNRMSYLKTSDGSILFGGISGLNRFNPADFREFKSYYSKLQVTEYDEWDARTGKLVNQSRKFFSENQKLILNSQNRSFQIKFALLDYEKLSENRYAYQIEGIDRDWINVRENYLRFTGLPYGKFTLRIKGATAGGGWSMDELRIPIEVRRPFYLMGWFFMLEILMLTGLSFLAFRWRVYRLAESKERLKQEVDSRTEELERDKQTIAAQNKELEALNQTKDHLMAIIGHELRGPMLSIQNIGDSISYLLKSGKFAQAAALGQQVKYRVFSVRMLLDNLLYWGLSQSGKQEVYSESVSIRAIMVESIELVEFWIASKSLHLTINCPENLVGVTDRNIVRMVLLNLLTNAIKFTPKGGMITLTAGEDKPTSRIFIRVSDTGIGISLQKSSEIHSGNFRSGSGTEGEKGTGIGLNLCFKLLQSLEGSLIISGIIGVGSSFEIWLPQNVKDKHNTHGAH